MGWNRDSFHPTPLSCSKLQEGTGTKEDFFVRSVSARRSQMQVLNIRFLDGISYCKLNISRTKSANTAREQVYFSQFTGDRVESCWKGTQELLVDTGGLNRSKIEVSEAQKKTSFEKMHKVGCSIRGRLKDLVASEPVFCTAWLDWTIRSRRWGDQAAERKDRKPRLQKQGE